MKSTWTVEWRRYPRQRAKATRPRRLNPHALHGRDVVAPPVTGGATCTVPVSYPAAGYGAWRLHCLNCGRVLAVETHGHRDDPRTVTVACFQGRDA